MYDSCVCPSFLRVPQHASHAQQPFEIPVLNEKNLKEGKMPGKCPFDKALFKGALSLINLYSFLMT